MKTKNLRTKSTVLSRSLNDPSYRWFYPTQLFLSFVTLISIVVLILDSVESLLAYSKFFHAVELIAAVIFTCEYIARIRCAKSSREYMFSFWGVIDLLSIFPSFFHLSNIRSLESSRILRILRLIRIVRLAKLSRLTVRDKNRKNEIRQLGFAAYVLALVASIIILGTSFYAVEAHVNASYEDIPRAMFESSKLLFGIDFAQPTTAAGGVIMLVGGFMGVLLLSLLINVIGPAAKKLLLGSYRK